MLSWLSNRDQARIRKKTRKTVSSAILTHYSLFLLDNIIIIQDNSIELSLKLFHDVSIYRYNNYFYSYNNNNYRSSYIRMEREGKIHLLYVTIIIHNFTYIHVNER